MHWRTKAKIQNLISLLPSSVSYSAYYWIQRRFGRLKRIDPRSRISAAREAWRLIAESGRDPSEKVFLEIGTGRTPVIPLAYWLMGAKKTITIDLNPYLKWELVLEALDYIDRNPETIEKLLGTDLQRDRLDALLSFYKTPSRNLASFLELSSIEYLAPMDASKTTFPDCSIDFHTSYTVFEHIPPLALHGIVLEGGRLLKEEGLFIHKIDYSDHFSHSDKHISSVNFLQFSDRDWNKLAGNRYMYMNRLRHEDYLSLFEKVGHKVENSDAIMDEEALRLLQSKSIAVDERFETYSNEILATRNAWIVAKSTIYRHI